METSEETKTVTVPVRITPTMAAEVRRRAKRFELKPAAYIRLVVAQSLEQPFERVLP